MILRSQIDNFLNNIWGNSYLKTTRRFSDFTDSIAFSKPISGAEPILMVIIPPIRFDRQYNAYIEYKDIPIKFFLYDRETEMVFGCVSEISLANDWKNSLFYKITTAQERMERSECPSCGFWLL